MLADPAEGLPSAPLCFAARGFSLHAATRIDAEDGVALQRYGPEPARSIHARATGKRPTGPSTTPSPFSLNALPTDPTPLIPMLYFLGCPLTEDRWGR